MSYNLDRAARDPYYRIAYEDRQRQEADARRVNDMLAAGRAKASTQPAGTSASSFSMPSSPGVSYSSHASSGAHSASGADPIAWLLRFMAPPALFLVFTIGLFHVYAHYVTSSLGRLHLWALFFAAALGFAIRFWRQVAVIALVVALYYVAR